MSETNEFEFEIEDGYEVPEARDRIGAKYPFGSLEVGQSFFVPHVDTKKMTASTKFWRNKFPDRMWVTRKQTKEINGEQVEGVRIWRTE